MADIVHDPSTQRFSFTIDGLTGFLSYEVIDEHTLDYSHTIVPKELGGRGLGGALVEHALAYAREHHKKVVPSCSFVASYIDKHAEYQSLLA